LSSQVGVNLTGGWKDKLDGTGARSCAANGGGFSESAVAGNVGHEPRAPEATPSKQLFV
jgi:hypothetical protein